MWDNQLAITWKNLSDQFYFDPHIDLIFMRMGEVLTTQILTNNMWPSPKSIKVYVQGAPVGIYMYIMEILYSHTTFFKRLNYSTNCAYY